MGSDDEDDDGDLDPVITELDEEDTDPQKEVAPDSVPGLVSVSWVDSDDDSDDDN